VRLIDESERRVIVLDPAPLGPAAPIGSARIARPPRLSAWPWARLRIHISDPWAIALLAAALSIGFFVWYEAHGMTLAFNDARIRELIARRVLDSRTPGLAQLGTTWLPLPTLLMLPLIWSDTLFRDGLAGSLPSMAAYVIGAVYMYRTGRLVAGSRAGGWIAAAALMLNPSLLYMQSTAMSEVPSLTAFVVGIYYAVRLAETHHAPDLVKCAAAVAAGTLIRYDDWVLAVALVPTLGLIAWRHRGKALAEAWTILFGLLAFAGCLAWVIYNWVIFNDPLLSFFYGSSSHTFFANDPSRVLPARGHPVGAFVEYALTVAGTVGWLLLPAALLGLLLFVRRRRLGSSALPAYLLLVPFAFYWLVLYKGANTESLPQLGQGSYYNVRFGLAMLPAVGVFMACLAVARTRLLSGALAGGALALIVASAVIGWAGRPFVVREALDGPSGAGTAVVGKRTAEWFAPRYHGGGILITYVNSQTMMFYLLTKHHLADRAFITDANGPQFERALAHPERFVRWIVMDADATNGASPIWTALHRRTAWQRYFVLRGMFATSLIYERVGTGGPPALPPAPAVLGAGEAQLAPYPATMMPRAREVSAAGEIYRDVTRLLKQEYGPSF
jgi:Dolichyl-phosphate-mannose-protein mannosyltransferase